VKFRFPVKIYTQTSVCLPILPVWDTATGTDDGKRRPCRIVQRQCGSSGMEEGGG